MRWETFTFLVIVIRAKAVALRLSGRFHRQPLFGVTDLKLNGFSRFYDKRDAQDALDAMDGRMLDGRELRVQMARYGRPTSPQRGGGGGGGRRYGGGRERGRSRDRHRRRSRSLDRPRGGVRRSYSRSRSRSRDRSRSGSKSSRGKESRSRSPLDRGTHY